METFTQPKITGYRQLSEADAELMNSFKSDLGSYLVTAVSMAMQHVRKQRMVLMSLPTDTQEQFEAKRVELKRIEAAQPERWIAIANTHFQEGLMALTRAVAQPSSF